MHIAVTRGVIETIEREVHAAHPEECCGILLGDGETISEARPAKNVHPEPLTRFEIDPAALIAAHKAAREGGPKLMGYYHSHPNGPAAPSATDLALSARDGSVWAIAASEGIQFWQCTAEGFAALSTESAWR